MYSFHVKKNKPFQEVIPEVVEALKTEGFGVLTEIDVQATMKKKLGLDQKPYLILGACNPQLAHQALGIDPDVGLLLPCNVVISEEEQGEVTVRFMDPMAVMGLVNHPEMLKVAEEALVRLQRAAKALS